MPAQTTDDVKCELHQFERNRNFYGKLETVRDRDAQDAYVRGHRYLHNQSLHGSGVICGLAVTHPQGDANRGIVRVSAGVALDCCGRELVLAKAEDVDLADFESTLLDQAVAYLCIAYDECVREPVPALANVSTCEEVCEHNRIQEKVRFDVVLELPDPPDDDPCATWTNVATVVVPIRDDETVVAELTRSTPRWVHGGDLLEVRRQVRIVRGDAPLTIRDVLPPGFTLAGGTLEIEIDGTAGEVLPDSYLVRVAEDAALDEHQVSAEVLRSTPEPVAGSSSSIAVIDGGTSIERQRREALVQGAFATCPRCGNGKHGIVLARIGLDTTGDQIAVKSVSDVAFDEERGIYRDLVYPMPLVARLLECLARQPKGGSMPSPASTVTSVGSAKLVGTASRYARADHVHDLRVSGVGPDENGDLHLRAGENVTIRPNPAQHELTISVSGTVDPELGSPTSVQRIAAAGSSPRFARGDHAHDLPREFLMKMLPIRMGISRFEHGMQVEIDLRRHPLGNPFPESGVSILLGQPMRMDGGEGVVRYPPSSNDGRDLFYALVPLPFQGVFTIFRTDDGPDLVAWTAIFSDFGLGE